jgi:hypothetical protein
VRGSRRAQASGASRRPGDAAGLGCCRVVLDVLLPFIVSSEADIDAAAQGAVLLEMLLLSLMVVLPPCTPPPQHEQVLPLMLLVSLRVTAPPATPPAPPLPW